MQSIATCNQLHVANYTIVTSQILNNREFTKPDGDAKENVDEKLNLYFIYESRATIKSFASFITVETIATKSGNTAINLKQ